MTLPSELVSTYRQYKGDMDVIVTWVASTARYCGYEGEMIKVDARSPQKGRLKGKARKNAKVGLSLTGEPIVKATIHPGHILPLAQYVLSCTKPEIVVPNFVVDSISSALAAKSAFVYQLSIDYGVKPVAKVAAAGFLVVNMLRKLRELLKPRMPEASEQPPKVVIVEDKQKRPQAESLKKQTLKPATKKSAEPGSQILFEFEPETSERDAVTFFGMLATDLNRMRQVIKKIWAEFRQGKMDITAAAVASNTAIELATELLDDIMPLLDQHSGYGNIITKLFYSTGLRCGYTMDQLSCWTHQTQDVWEMSCNSFHTAFVMVEDAYSWQDDVLWLTCPDRIKPSCSVVDSSILGKFNNNQDKLTDIMREASALVNSVCAFPYQDEFIRGVRELKETRKTPFRLVFATQVILDIQEVIGTDMTQIVHMTVDEGTHLVQSLRHTIAIHDNAPPRSWSQDTTRRCRHMLQGNNEPILLDPADPRYADADAVDAKSQNFLIFKYSPIACGLTLYHFRNCLYDSGLFVSDDWGSMAWAVHLYNALQKEGLLSSKWADLEALQTLVGDSCFFARGRPATREGYFRTALANRGAPAGMFQSNNPNHKKRIPELLEASRTSARAVAITRGAVVSMMFHPRYGVREKKGDWTTKFVQDFVSMLEYSHPPQGALSQEPALRGVLRSDGRYAPATMVRIISVTLNAEMPEFTFPYLGMHRQAWYLLEKIKYACEPILTRMFSLHYCDWRKSEMPEIVGFLLGAAGYMPEVYNEAYSRKPLQIAARVVQKFLDAGKGKVLSEQFESDIGMSVAAASTRGFPLPRSSSRT